MQNDLVADLPNLSNRYEILELVRNDRTWVTLKARDHVLKKDVYLKTVRESHSLNDADMAEFESQARLAARLSHPRIEPILDFGNSSGAPYMVTDCMDGLSLRDFIATNGISLDEAMGLFCSICEIVEYMHDHKIQHNNLSLDTLLLVANSQGEIEVNIVGLDFARGTGDIGLKSSRKRSGDSYEDIKALGLVFQKVLLNRQPRNVVQFAGAFQRRDDGAVLTRKLGHGIMEAIIDRCLTDDRKDRFQSVFSLKKELVEARQRLLTWDDTLSFNRNKSHDSLEDLPWHERFAQGLDDSAYLFIHFSLLLAIASIVLYYLFARVF